MSINSPRKACLFTTQYGVHVAYRATDGKPFCRRDRSTKRRHCRRLCWIWKYDWDWSQRRLWLQQLMDIEFFIRLDVSRCDTPPGNSSVILIHRISHVKIGLRFAWVARQLHEQTLWTTFNNRQSIISNFCGYYCCFYCMFRSKYESYC